MSRSKCSRELYCSFLQVTSQRYSALSLSEIVPTSHQLSHDSISRWLSEARVQPKDIWAVARKEVAGTTGVLAFDDVVIDKSRSGKTELVNWQYSGAKHDVTKGIGVVNAVWQKAPDDFIPIDYRIWNPPEDGKTKNDHFRDMLSSVKARGLNPDRVIADSWYSSLDNLKCIRSHGWVWVMGLRSNRLVNKPHVPISSLTIPVQGLKVHLKGYGMIKLFRFVTTHGRTDYLGTSDLDATEDSIKTLFGRRWSIEVLHKELKQTCGLSRCLANTGRSQRNHIGLSMLTWIRKNQRRCMHKITLYQQQWEVIRPAVSQALALQLRSG